MIIIKGIENTTNPPANSNGIVFKRNIFDNISLLTTIICIKHGYADMIVYGDCSCCLFPHNEISIACGANDITFNTTNKILKLEINKDISMYSNIYNVKIEIIDKG